MEDVEEIRILRKMEKARDHNNTEEIMNLKTRLAVLFSERGKYNEALAAYYEVLDICKTNGDKFGEANANRMISEILLNQAQYEESLNCANIYLDYAKTTKNKIEEQRAYTTLGRLYFCWASHLKTDYYTKKKSEDTLKLCLQAFKKSLIICESDLKNIPTREKLEMRAKSLYNIGIAYDLQGNSKGAKLNISKAIEVCQAQKFYEDCVRCYLAQGELYVKEGDHTAAIYSFDSALAAAKHLSNDKEHSVIAMQHKAKAYILIKNYMGAKHVLKQAYKLKSPNQTDHITIKKQLIKVIEIAKCEEELLTIPLEDCETRKKLYEKEGDLCCSLENYKHAIECYVNMLDCAQRAGESGKSLSPCYSSLMETYKDNKEFDLALEYCIKEEKLNQGNLKELCATYESMAEILKLKNSGYCEISASYFKAEEIAKEIGDIPKRVSIMKNLFKLQKNFGKLELAAETESQLMKLKRDHNYISENEDSDSGCSSDTDSIGIDLNDVLTDSDNEKEFERPRIRNQRCKYKIKRNEKGESELHVAAIKNNIKRVIQLIDQGHPVKVCDEAGWTPLHEACNYGYLDIVKVLVESGADVNAPAMQGITPLHDSATNGHLEVVEYLLQKGACTSTLTDDQSTPLDCLKDWKRKGNLTAEEEKQYRILEEKLRGNLDIGSQKHRILKKGISALVAEDQKNENNKRPRFTRGNEKSSNTRTFESLRRICDDDFPSGGNQWFRSRFEEEEEEEEENKVSESKNKTSATYEYKSAMEIVRKRAAPTMEEVPKKQNVPALLEEDDRVEDWLEDDVGVNQKPQKRRKILNVNLIEHTNVKNKTTASKCITVGQSFSSEKNDFNELDSIEVESEDDVTSHLQIFHKKPKLQTKLTKSVSVVPKTCEQQLQFSQSEHQPPESRSPSQEVQNSIQSSNLYKVRLKVQEQLLLIPIQISLMESLTIKWLTDEASKRYYKLEGAEPKLRLKTKDGAILSETDPLSLIHNEDLDCVIVEMKIPDISQKFKEECSLLGKEEDLNDQYCGYKINGNPDTHLLKCLDEFQSTRCLNLENLALVPSQIQPLFMALRHETSMDILNLGGNALGNEGVLLLSSCLEKCCVKKINLSCNNISTSGVIKFTENLIKNGQLVLENLLVLDFSYNPIGDGCFDILKTLVEKTNNLTLIFDFCDFKKPLVT